MTENEAIKVFKELLDVPCEMLVKYDSVTNEEQKKALVKIRVAEAMAIKALEEIQQYRAIGTVEELKALKEKNEPKKVKTNKYLVGDRVVYIGDSLDFKGKMGTIIRLAEKHGKEYNQVKFDDPYFIDDDGYKYCDYFCFAENLQKLDWQ